MKPQANEPCYFCRLWQDNQGCTIGRYNSASMVIFGYCAFKKDKPKKKVK